jgi:hypothetical protein
MSRDAASADEDRTALNQQFYWEYKDDLLYAAGLDSRPLDVEDQAVIEVAFLALGWTRQQQLMFADGAPVGAISHKLRRALRKTNHRSAREAA